MITNGITLYHIATGIIEEVALNGKEMQLAMDKGPDLNDSWAMMCESVESRTGLAIMDGNWELEHLILGGEKKVLH
tara:strand:+ start:216 stop:443 length:228 start_codon:yes stop_codon:yes gene_type:complete